MLDYLYQSGWGAFIMMLLLEIPFVTVFMYVIFRKSFVDQAPSTTKRSKLARMESVWIVSVVVIFIAINVASIKYMPTVIAAQINEENLENVEDVSVSATSWSYDISDREYEVGQTIRFSIKSTDTVHGFAVYHPDGTLLFTTMLMPGVTNPTTMFYTFTDPGIYKVRCTEYCGIAHHLMQDQLTVVQKSNS